VDSARPEGGNTANQRERRCSDHDERVTDCPEAGIQQSRDDDQHERDDYRETFGRAGLISKLAAAGRR
jgi:hypothetical protein